MTGTSDRRDDRGDDPARHLVAPLTRCALDGKLFLRLPAVEREIGALLALPVTDVIDAARVPPDLPGHVHAEALVYMLRFYRRHGTPFAVNALAQILLDRCTPLLKHHLGALRADRFDDAYADAVEQLFTLLLDLESDRADFYQVRFWLALRRLVISTFQRHVAPTRDAWHVVERRGSEDEDGRDPIDRLPSPRDVMESVEKRDLIRHALSVIPEPSRTAFILRYYWGWPTEDANPDNPSISRYFDRTSRTVRNWLREADAALTAWRGANQ